MKVAETLVFLLMEPHGAVSRVNRAKYGSSYYLATSGFCPITLLNLFLLKAFPDSIDYPCPAFVHEWLR